jgi:hypothetical protein
MSEDNNTVESKEVVMYGYKNSEGKMFWTSNLEFANIRANYFGTFDIYEEKN